MRCRSSRHNVRRRHRLWVTRNAAASVTRCKPLKFKYSRAAHLSATADTPSSLKEAQKDTSKLLSFDWAQVVAKAYTPASVTSVQNAQWKSSSCFSAFATTMSVSLLTPPQYDKFSALRCLQPLAKGPKPALVSLPQPCAATSVACLAPRPKWMNASSVNCTHPSSVMDCKDVLCLAANMQHKSVTSPQAVRSNDMASLLAFRTSRTSSSPTRHVPPSCLPSVINRLSSSSSASRTNLHSASSLRNARAQDRSTPP
mmetsp:Transcript_8500/g.24116  ORF Transcript_8500/g.24116 Transcript_8500/m.24116 type:complete len:256 (+) Transcript_8500:1591-2358(+)